MIKFKKKKKERVILRKYELLHSDSIIAPDGITTLYRLVAVRSFSHIKKGALGGYIEKESNLSHDGDSWVYQSGIVYGNASVSGNALVADSAVLSGNALIQDNARLKGNAEVTDNAIVKDSASVMQHAKVAGNAVIRDTSIISGNAMIKGRMDCSGHTAVSDNVILDGHALIYGSTCIYGDIQLYLNGSSLYNANICDMKNIIIIQGIGPRYGVTTVYRDNDGFPYITTCGRFKGDIHQYMQAVKTAHNGDQWSKEYNALIDIVMNHDFGTEELIQRKYNRWKLNR